MDIATGLCTVVLTALRVWILDVVHEGHLGTVKVKQHCRGAVWWPVIDRDVETMVKDTASPSIMAYPMEPHTVGHLW